VFASTTKAALACFSRIAVRPATAFNDDILHLPPPAVKRTQRPSFSSVGCRRAPSFLSAAGATSAPRPALPVPHGRQGRGPGHPSSGWHASIRHQELVADRVHGFTSFPYSRATTTTGMVAAAARSGASARWLEDRPPAVALEQGCGGPSSIPPPATVLRLRGRASATGEAGGVVKLAAATRRSEERRRSAGGDAPPLPLGWRRVEAGAVAEALGRVVGPRGALAIPLYLRSGGGSHLSARGVMVVLPAEQSHGPTIVGDVALTVFLG
jgi:hypothetical protein